MNKKLVLSIVVLVSIGIITMTSSCFSKKQKIEAERIASLISQGDSVVMTEFLKKGDTALKAYAFEKAKDYNEDYLSRTDFGIITLRGEPITMEMVKLSFQVTEDVLGTDSLAVMLYEYNTYDKYWLGNIETGQWWNERTDQIMSVLSEKLKQKIKKIVLTKNEDPFWVYKYVSSKEMRELILNNHFGFQKTCNFVPRCGDSVLITEIANSISDSNIVAFKIGNAVSKQRRARIASQLPLNEAYNFFLESGVPDKEIKKLISSRISETEGYDLLFYFATHHLTESQVVTELAKKSTKKLVDDFPKRTTVEIWSFPYEKFATQVIHSVKNFQDYHIALTFFKQTAEYEDVWIERLQKKIQSET